MKTPKLLLIIMLAVSAAFAQQRKPKELSLSISAKKNTMPYNKIMVNVEIKNISNRNIELLDYFNDKENGKMFLFSNFFRHGIDLKTSSETYSGGINVAGTIEIAKPGEALKFRKFKPQQVYRFTLNLHDLFEDPSTKLPPGRYIVSLSYFIPKVAGCEDCFSVRYTTSNEIDINVTN